MDDHDLLKAYAQEQSEDAFTELVARRIDFVYATALRRVGEPHLARDVAQTVFCLLARKAGSLPESVQLLGWLHRTACFAASDALRQNRRRRERELKSAAMQDSPESEPWWQDAAPLIDEAINRLSENERKLALLRFVEQKSMKELGSLLGVSEDAAKMRVSRVVEKLRRLMAKQGAVCSSAALAAALSKRMAEAAPAEMARTVARDSLVASKAAAGISLASRAQFYLGQNAVKLAGLGLAAGLVGGTAFHYHHAGLIGHVWHRIEAAHNTLFLAFTDRQAQEPQPVLQNPALASASAVSDPALLEALAELHRALHPTRNFRRLPVDEVRRALEKFGEQRRAALPELLAALREGGQAERLAMAGLEALGPDAADAMPAILERADRLLRLMGRDAIDVICSIRPAAELIPQFLPKLSEPESSARPTVADLIARLAQAAPAHAAPYRLDLAELIRAADLETRFYAAFALSQFPGGKDPIVLPELTAGLRVEALREPGRYLPRMAGRDSFPEAGIQNEWADQQFRALAVRSLAQLGREAEAAAPALKELAEALASAPPPQIADANSTQREYIEAAVQNRSQLRRQVLEALAAIRPEERTQEIEKLFAEREETAQLMQKLRASEPARNDLIEALKWPQTAVLAASILARDKSAGMSCLRELQAAQTTQGMDALAGYEIAQAIKAIDPKALLPGLADPRSVYESAGALGELGPEAGWALGPLQEALERGPASARPVVAESIHKIDPRAPQALFGWEDLNPAVSDLVRQAEAAGGDTARRAQVLYARHGQELQDRTRGEVAAFAKAVREELPALHEGFVARLVERNPSLKSVLMEQRAAAK